MALHRRHGEIELTPMSADEFAGSVWFFGTTRFERDGENQVTGMPEERFLHYQTDTAPGSSGSPVFNDQWEVVALHHSGVPRRNSEGKILTVDGRIWTGSMGEHRIDWVANEGIRVVAIITALQEEDLPARQ